MGFFRQLISFVSKTVALKLSMECVRKYKRNEYKRNMDAKEEGRKLWLQKNMN